MSRAWHSALLLPLIWALAMMATGCAVVPSVRTQPQYHNPFPQLQRVAILPFYNQSAEPTVNQDDVARAYYNELQAIPGFEVMPVGVAKRLLESQQLEPQTDADFQKVAQLLGVDAVVVGSVTEFSPYYPPRMGLAVNWYAANPGFHPIPAGYGLPWGTKDEDKIPPRTLFEAEFALAREQLRTQEPAGAPVGTSIGPPVDKPHDRGGMPPAISTHSTVPGQPILLPPSAPTEITALPPGSPDAESLPADWPDPRGFVPDPPSPARPPLFPQTRPVMTHTRLYHGNDEDFTERLAEYFFFRDDARFGGWQAYLQRSDDFVRFCCHLHVVDMLADRGGRGKTRVVWRWPIDRYQR